MRGKTKARRATSKPKQRARKCAHPRAGAVVMVDVETYECNTCGALGVRPLGPSNDEPEAVRVEMRAADKIAQIASHYGGDSDAWCDDETTTFAGGPWQDEFNARLWPWDPTLPIAEQQPGQAACHRHPTANRNADGDCIECVRERTVEATAQEDEIRRSLAAPDEFETAEDDDAPVDPATKFGELARQVTVPVVAPDAFDDEAFDVSDVLPNSEQR